MRDSNLTDQNRFRSGWSDHSWLGSRNSSWASNNLLLKESIFLELSKRHWQDLLVFFNKVNIEIGSETVKLKSIFNCLKLYLFIGSSEASPKIRIV